MSWEAERKHLFLSASCLRCGRAKPRDELHFRLPRHADGAGRGVTRSRRANSSLCLRPVCVAGGLRHWTDYTSVRLVAQTAPGAVLCGTCAQTSPCLRLVCVAGQRPRVPVGAVLRAAFTISISARRRVPRTGRGRHDCAPGWSLGGQVGV